MLEPTKTTGLLTRATTPRETTVKQRPSAMQPPDRQLDKKTQQLKAQQQELQPVVRPQAQLFSPMAVSSRTLSQRTLTCLRARSSLRWSRATV